MKIRVIQDPMNGNRFQAQYRSAELGDIWCDIGDGKDTQEQAWDAVAEYERHRARGKDVR